MIFDSKAFLYSNTITHEGKLIVFGIEDGGDGQANIWYTVKQDGFEKSYLDANPSQISGWEEWKLLGFPNEDDDTSVTAKEEKDRKAQSDPNRFLIGSSYQSSSRTEIAPIQVVSGLGHLYVFRQSRDNTLLADRFVLDGMANKLTRKFEVRYRRSKKRFKSAGNEIGSETGLLQKIDSLDFKDIEGKPFYEPTTELSVICNLTAGEFSVVLLPTSQQDKYRWHIFAYNNETKLVEITSIQASDEGLFDIQDQAVQDPTMRSIPGIIRHKLDFKDAAFSRGLTATRYEVQRATQTDTGTQLIRDSIRVMAAFVTTAGNTVAVSFSVATDGTLSQIAETPSETEQLRFTPKAVLLPFNDLDDIVARVDEPLPKGAIQAIRQGDDEKELLTIGTADAPGVKPADSVKLSSIADFNKVFQTVMTIDENTFEVSPPSAAIGNWELVPEDPKTLYEGMITGYRTVDGRLRITAVNHGLETGDRVRITGTRDYSGVYSVKSVGNREITFESTSWETGSAINVGKIRDNRRHSLVFDGVDDYVQLPAMTFDFAKGVTLEAWVRYYSLRNWSRILDFGNGQGNLNIVLANTDVSGELRFFIDNEESVAYVSVSAPDALPLDSWIHVAATVEPSGKATLYTDGVELASGMLEGTPEPVSRTQNYIGKSNWEGDEFFEGQIADVRIWSRALSRDEIRNNMYRPLTGQEKDLRGFWRLNGIADAQTPDFSGFGNDGVVFGGAYISGSRIGRDVSVPFGSGATPKSQPATRFDNDNLIAVTSGAVYTEEFEFRVWGTRGDPVEPPVNPFEIIWRGKQTRASLEWSEIKPFDSTAIENIGVYWYKASARFRVPDGIRFVRQFGIAKVTGKWSEIEIRKHAIVMISDTVTMVTYSDSANLETLTDPSNENRDTCRLIARYELRQARLEIQRRSLAAAAADSSPAALQRKIDEKTKFLEVLQLEIDRWSERLGWARQNLEDIKKKVTVFWRENYTAESLVLDVGSYRDLGAYYNEVRGRDWGKEICSVKVPDGLCLTLYENMDFDGESLPLTSDTPRLRPYRLSRRDTSWHDEALSLAVHVRNGSSDAEEVERDINLRQVALEVRERAKQDAREAIEQLKVALDDPGNPSRRLEQVNDDLGKIQIPALSEFPGTQAQSMPTIKMFKGLGTQAAVLDFVKPTGRLHALETCEGNVQLAYFDENGRMRQTNFDATVDSANAFSEQWIVDPIVRSCLDFSGGQSLTLDESVELGDEWTAEAWFFYPLPDNGGQWRLFSAKSKDDPVIVVKSGDEERLGLKVDGRFFDSAFDMKELSIGWHHLAAVANEDGTTFYIDGQNVGTAEAKSSEDIYGICGNLDGHGQSFGKVAEVRIWENALSSEEILANSVTTLTGNEAGLVAYLPMTDGLGQSVTDKSGNRHDGTVVGIPAWVACTAPIGHFGHQVVRFDMASDSINLPHFGAGAFNQNQITYEAWVRYDDQHSRIRVVTFENSTTSDSIALIVDGNTDNLTIEVANAESQKQISADNALKCGEWQHLAVTLDPSGNAELFVNGIMVKSGIVHAPPDVDFDSNFIGKGFAESGETYSVLIAEIRIWNIIRTVDEIRNGMSRRLSDDVDGLVSYWPLDQHSLKKSSASGDPITVKDKVETWDDGTLAGESFLMISNTLPISGNTLACAEYATIGVDLRTQKDIGHAARFSLDVSGPYRSDFRKTCRIAGVGLDRERTIRTDFAGLYRRPAAGAERESDDRRELQWRGVGRIVAV
ncbi:MAG: LamG domain-containing protein [Acidobacteria bacterium]|nr:LamG domain-containing protein [Acidobacteriota bacterium]